jgi:hypothetical protein
MLTVYHVWIPSQCSNMTKRQQPINCQMRPGTFVLKAVDHDMGASMK